MHQPKVTPTVPYKRITDADQLKAPGNVHHSLPSSRENIYFKLLILVEFSICSGDSFLLL